MEQQLASSAAQPSRSAGSSVSEDPVAVPRSNAEQLEAVVTDSAARTQNRRTKRREQTDDLFNTRQPPTAKARVSNRPRKRTLDPATASSATYMIESRDSDDELLAELKERQRERERERRSPVQRRSVRREVRSNHTSPKIATHCPRRRLQRWTHPEPQAPVVLQVPRPRLSCMSYTDACSNCVKTCLNSWFANII